MEKCSSYTPGEGLCRDGFPVSAICTGTFGCFSCGHVSRIPACQREDLGPHLLDDRGLPRYAHYLRSPEAAEAIAQAKAKEMERRGFPAPAQQEGTKQ